MDIPDDHTPELDAYIIRAFYTRGEIIENFILLERIMDEFIAMEFSETLERRLQLMSILISEGLSFHQKIKVTKRIIRSHIKDDKVRHKRIGSIESDLKYIAGVRNKFAHDIMRTDIKKEYLLKFQIMLYSYYKDEYTSYEANEIKDIIEHINKYILLFNQLREEFWAK